MRLRFANSSIPSTRIYGQFTASKLRDSDPPGGSLARNRSQGRDHASIPRDYLPGVWSRPAGPTSQWVMSRSGPRTRSVSRGAGRSCDRPPDASGSRPSSIGSRRRTRGPTTPRIDEGSFGDTVWASIISVRSSIAYIDDSKGSTKSCPALIISSDEECDSGEDLLVLAITKRFEEPCPPYHFKVHDRRIRDPLTGTRLSVRREMQLGQGDQATADRTAGRKHARRPVAEDRGGLRSSPGRCRF